MSVPRPTPPPEVRAPHRSKKKPLDSSNLAASTWNVDPRAACVSIKLNVNELLGIGTRICWQDQAEWDRHLFFFLHTPDSSHCGRAV